MLIVVITLKNTDHQIRLAFKSAETLAAASRAGTISDPNRSIKFRDDFGAEAQYDHSEIASILTYDAAGEAERMNHIKLIQMRADQQFRQKINEDPTLRFLTDDNAVSFGAD